MKLEWQMSSDGDRVFAHVKDACLFADILQDGTATIHLLATDATVGGALPRDWAWRKFANKDEAIEAMEDWYNSTRKEQGDD